MEEEVRLRCRWSTALPGGGASVSGSWEVVEARSLVEESVCPEKQVCEGKWWMVGKAGSILGDLFVPEDCGSRIPCLGTSWGQRRK